MKEKHRRNRMRAETKTREPYAKPELVKHENLKDITFECPNWQCSVTVPPPPA
jgi:hypothetical protein